MLTFLDYLSKNRTVGTQSTGNLPLKAVHAICERFVDPPKLEQTIGGHAFKVRSEDEVWPLLFVHTLAFHSGLVDGGAAAFPIFQARRQLQEHNFVLHEHHQ